MSAVLPARASTPAQVAVGDMGPHTRMIWRADACAHLTLTRGRCPGAAGEALVSERTLQGDYGWRLGDRLTLSNLPRPVTVTGSDEPGKQSPAVTVVGAYRLASDPFWQGHGYFDAHPGPGDGPDTVDALFVDRAELPTLFPARLEVQVDYPIDATEVRLSDATALAAHSRTG